jgi:hypothetical protein
MIDDGLTKGRQRDTDVTGRLLPGQPVVEGRANHSRNDPAARLRRILPGGPCRERYIPASPTPPGTTA